jgi:hypothetical protein
LDFQLNEQPPDFIENDREDQAENRDVRQADIQGADRQNLPLNHKADALIGATISEDRNQDEARPGRELYSWHDRRQRRSGLDRRRLAAREVIGAADINYQNI